jgi:Sodium/hydrogen exchanger family
MRSVETVLLLVVLGTVVAVFAGRLQIPAPSLLVVAGLLIGLLPGVPAVRVPPEVVSLVVLPPLLYAASEELPWRDLRAVWRPVIILAVGLVLASAAAVAVVAGAVAAVPDDAAPDAVIDRARASLQARIGQTRAGADGTWAPGPDGLTERELRRDLIGAENAELARLYENGIISAAIRQRLQHNLDLEATRLSDDQH